MDRCARILHAGSVGAEPVSAPIEVLEHNAPGVAFAVSAGMRRKQLRLPHYDYAASGAYFVTICTVGRRAHLCGLTGEMVLRHLLRLPARFPGLTVDDNVVMASHVHAVLLLDGSTPALPRIVQAFKSLTALEAPAAVRPMWQRGYYEHVVRDEDELALIREYIHNNPLAEEIKFGRSALPVL